MTQKRILGIFIVFIGGLFLLDSFNIGIDAWGMVESFWPIIIIAFGITNLIGSDGVRLSGVIMIVVGVIFLIETSGYSVFGLDAWDIILPGIIIIIGVWLLFPKNGSNVSSRHFIKQMAIFSGATTQCDSDEFKGADLVAIFGGLDLDLRYATVGEEKPAKIDVFAAFGGVDIIVPEGMKVMITGIPLFGGWSNKSLKATHSGEADVVINAFVLFGGMDVKTRRK